jgi:hypothetical protein
MHDYVVVYSKKKDVWKRNLLPRSSSAEDDYSNPDNDERGDWTSNALQSRNYYSKGTYAITCPGGRVIEGPPRGTYWRMEEDKLWELDRDNRVWWGKSKNNSPRIKKFLDEAKEGVVPSTWWEHRFAGTNSGAKTELREILGEQEQELFNTPKPWQLIQRILQVATPLFDADSAAAQLADLPAAGARQRRRPTFKQACHELPSLAVDCLHRHHRTPVGARQSVQPAVGFPADMPYFCLRVPTGGGKTWLAAKSVAARQHASAALRAQRDSVAGAEQADPRADDASALKDRQHPYHAALREAGPITVMDLEEAKSVTRATLDTSTTVIVATRQAFQVEDEECRKVYQSSGALMHHFDNLSPTQRDELLERWRGQRAHDAVFAGQRAAPAPAFRGGG